MFCTASEARRVWSGSQSVSVTARRGQVYCPQAVSSATRAKLATAGRLTGTATRHMNRQWE